MNSGTLADVVRSVVTFVLGFFASKFDPGTIAQIAGGVAAIVVAVWPMIFPSSTPTVPPPPPPAA